MHVYVSAYSQLVPTQHEKSQFQAEFHRLRAPSMWDLQYVDTPTVGHWEPQIVSLVLDVR